MNKTLLISIVSGVAFLLVFLILILTKKPKPSKNKFSEDLKLISQAKSNNKNLNKIKVEPILLKTEKFNTLYRKLSQKMKINVNDVVLEEVTQNKIQDIKEVKNNLLQGLISISNRRKELLASQ